jgi:HD-GYP domain-containing protein (c-di-GMP phosphodiesterase class II)
LARGALSCAPALQHRLPHADIPNVKLVSINAQDLLLDRALPFALRDASGRLLLNAGLTVADDRQRQELLQQPLFAEERHCADWRRRVNQAMDQQLRQGAALKDVVRARPDDGPREAAARMLSTGETWFELRSRLDTTLRDVRPGTDWLPRLQELRTRARALAEKRFDESLYHLVYESFHFTERYSAHHAWMTQMMVEQTARMLGWPREQIDSLGLAALTMNVSMLRLQDQLTLSYAPPTPDQRREIDTHAARSAAQLADAGLTDMLVTEAVLLHHDADTAGEPLSGQSTARRLARLLRRVDIFSANISRRMSRPAMSPLMAARQACLGADGQPDEIGGALLRAVGLYPPGSFVELVSGEVGIVVSRGRRANLPLVAVLVSASGNVHAEPMLRETLDRRHAVKAAVAPDRVKVRVMHDKVLALAAAASRLH